jgi:soluble cytochrome b562
MNPRFRPISLFALAVLSVSALLQADTPLEEQMNTMKDAFRSIKAAMEAPVDADKDKYVASADALKSAAVKAKGFDPQKLAEIPENERDQFLADYRQAIDNLVGLIDQLKTQLAAGDWDAARAQFRLIFRAQGAGHEKFRSEES